MAKRKLFLVGAGLAALIACVDRPGSTGPDGLDANRVGVPDTAAARE